MFKGALSTSTALLLAALTLAMAARGFADAPVPEPTGMYLVCYSTPTCFGFLKFQRFYNASEFNTDHFGYYEMMYQRTVYRNSTNIALGSDTSIRGDCNTPFFYVSGTNYTTNECMPDSSDSEGSCFASCQYPTPTVGSVTIELLLPIEREAADLKRQVADDQPSSFADIVEYLNLVNPFFDYEKMETYYTFENTPDECHFIYRANAPYMSASEFEGTPIYAKMSEYCKPGNEFHFEVYSDSECNTPSTSATGVANGRSRFTVGAPLAIPMFSAAQMSCVYLAPHESECPTPTPESENSH